VRTKSYLLIIFLAAFVLLPCFAGSASAAGAQGLTVTVGPADADVIGTDNVAIQKAIDRVAAAGGGTVLIKAGTYTLANSVRLASHLTLAGEGTGKTILKRAVGVRSRLKLDADYGEFIATVEDASRFAPGMGVVVVDKLSRSGWTPSVRTITRIDGSTLHFDRFLHMDYSVENDGQVFNTFPLVAGYEVEDVRVAHLTADGTRTASEPLDGCQAGAIYFFHSRQIEIRNVVAHNYPGDGISTQFVEDPVIENCEAYGNAMLGIHLGTGALRGVVRYNRAHANGEDGIYLCWRVQHGRFEENQSWSNDRDGISIGHKDTDNLFLKNIASANARAGIYFRDEPEINAGHRNTLRENTLEDNGRPGAPGYGVRIDGTTRHITLESNIIRDTRPAARATQHVGLFLGSRTDYIIAVRNVFSPTLKLAIQDQSSGANNRIEHPAASR
jgi:hypothetical protein